MIKLAAVAAGTSLLGCARRAVAVADANDPYGGLVPGAQSYSFRRLSLDNALAAMNKLGIREVELFPNHIAGLSPKQVTEKLAANDVKGVSYGVIPFSKDEAANRKMFELARSLGMKNLSCDPAPDAFESLDKLTAEYDITCAIHPHGPGHRWAKIDTIWNAVKDHSLKIGLCNDTGHFIRAGEDPVQACEQFKDRLYALHLKDFKKVADGKWEDVPAGQGSLDVDALVKFLLDHKFKGAMLVEYEGANEVESVGKSLDRVKLAVKNVRSR
jgi:sugar phosphate isomerase/epimerase